MINYRFYEYHGDIKHYLMFLPDGEIEPTENRSEATLFTEEDWLIWAKNDGFEREEIGQDEAMRLIGVERCYQGCSNLHLCPL